MVTDIHPNMYLFSEEVFGPLARIYRIADATAATGWANSSPYGLGGSVSSSDRYANIKSYGEVL